MENDNIKKVKTSTFEYSYYFLPEDKADAITTIYAFCKVSDDIVDNMNKSNDEKFSELSKWKNDFKSSLEKKSDNELLNKVVRIIKDYNLDAKYFFELLDGMEMDITKSRYETMDELLDYCYKVASAVGLICIEIFGYKNPSAKDFAINLGIALQLTNILRDIKNDFELGRVYIPEELINKFRFEKSKLTPQLLKYGIQITEEYYIAAMKALADEDVPNMLPALMMKDVYCRILKKIKKRCEITDNEYFRLSKAEKIFIALKSYLQYKILKRK